MISVTLKLAVRIKSFTPNLHIEIRLAYTSNYGVSGVFLRIRLAYTVQYGVSGVFLRIRQKYFDLTYFRTYFSDVFGRIWISLLKLPQTT